MIRIQFTDHHGATVLLDPKKHPSTTERQANRTIEKLKDADPPWLGKFKVIMTGAGRK